MMFGHDFYHGTIRRYIIMFGNIFNEIQVDRFDSTGTKIQSVNVPIEYSAKQKFIRRVLSDPNLTKQISTVVPRLGFEFTGMSYAPTRKLNTGHKFVRGVAKPGTSFDFAYTPVPYDFNFSLYALVKNAEDGAQIVEQIAPFFTPDWTVSVKVLPELNIILDVPIELTSISSSDEFEGDFETQRVTSWQLDFIVKGYLFGPVNRQKYINEVDINYKLEGFDGNIFQQVFLGNSEFQYTETITE